MAYDPNDPDTKAALKAAVDEAVDALASKRDELLAEVRKLKKGQQVDPADVQKLEDQLEAIKAENVKLTKDAKAQQAAAAKAVEDLTRVEGERTRMLVENGLNESLAKAGVTNPVHQKAARAMLAGQATVAEGAVLLNGKPLAESVSEWAKGDEGKYFVGAPGNSGGGSYGGGGGGTATDALLKIADPSARLTAARAAGLTK